MLKVATIIVTWNKLNDVCLLLADVAKLNIDNIQLDTYVVDNASTDETPAYLEQHYPQVKVLQTGENLGGSGGFSYGLQIVSKLEYDYLWLLDNDVRLDTQSLCALVETLQTYSEVGLVGSQIRKLDDPQTIQEIGSFIYPKKAHLKINFGNASVISTSEILQGKPYLSVDACAAASLLVRREVVQQIGVWEDFFIHFDDVEWCLRAKQASWVVAANPASIVWHASPDFKCRPWISYYDERNLCYCWQKHRPELVSRRVLVSLPRLTYYAATGRAFWAEVSTRGFEDFIKGVRGKMPGVLPYKEYALEEIINTPLKVFVQADIYKDKNQSFLLQRLQSDKKLLHWKGSENVVLKLGLWLSSWFWKPVDIAIVTCRHPNLYGMNLAKQVYIFTGSGYVLTKVNAITLLRAMFQTFYQLIQVYRRSHGV
ncbi:MAG: glycosyltransferase family 2 protein [Kastovskya adunca ATA6-11-RM4]|jgi:hypothetical protein|nr:glycosyltransferase family 2 protein [Kastovskya adunca ATA6-11-RM4]